MNRDYPLEQVRNFGVIAPISVAPLRFENPRFSTLALAGSLLSFTGKLQFSRPLSPDVRNYLSISI